MSDETRNELMVPEEETSLEGQVDEKAKELSEQIAMTENKNQLDNLYDEFRLNDTKKNIFRVNKLNNLLDKVVDEATARFTMRPGEMSNKEVLDYMTAIQNQIDHSKNTVDALKDINLTQVNNTVNVNIHNTSQPTLSRESRERVIDFIKGILSDPNNQMQAFTQDTDVIDVEGNEVNDDADQEGTN